MFYIIISFLAGITTVVSRIINSNLAKKIGIFQGTFFNYVVGLFFASLFFLLSSESFSLSSLSLSSVPFWAYLGGITGVLVVVLSSYITPRISSFYLTLLIFVGQLFMGIIIDFVSINKLSPGKVIGGVFVLIGFAYNLLIDKRQKESDITATT
jgi:transporter family-2 protein